MAVIRLLKDHKLGKAGAVVDKVPFHDAKILVDTGFAERQGPDGFPAKVEEAPVKAVATPVVKPVDIDPEFNRLESVKDTPKKGTK